MQGSLHDGTGNYASLLGVGAVLEELLRSSEMGDGLRFRAGGDFSFHHLYMDSL